jgi:metallo-beta-lactamase family protein
MKIKFCGAAREVTGSSHLLTLDNGKKILLDCGLYQGDEESMADYNKSWPYFRPSEIDILILSHAHIDHIGRVPRLVKDGFEGQIYCTHATRSLANIMLMDSAKIQVKEAGNYNTPLYNEHDVYLSMQQFIGVSYGRWLHIAEGVKIQFRDAGHILGSASVSMEIIQKNGKTIKFGFTGDIGRPERPILNDPVPMPEMDYLICESTYGNRVHEDKMAQISDLQHIVKDTCLINEGKLLIPAFSLGRTQEIVYMLDQLENAGKLPPVPIYVDSPLALSATEIYRLHPECYDEELYDYMSNDPNPFGFSRLHYIREDGLADNLAESKKPCIIISASGMMTAGRVRRHLFHTLRKKQNTVLVVGYAAPHTLGGRLRSNAKSVFLFGENVPVKANIKIMDSFSAHGDKYEMFDFIKNQRNVRKLFLTHGEYQVQVEWRDFLKESGFGHIEIPDLGEEFEIG